MTTTPPSKSFRQFLILFALLAFPSSAFSQTSMGSIVGSVTDESGAAVPGAKILVFNIDTNVKTEAGSSDAGVYSATSLIPGNYRIEIEKTGFDKSIVNSLLVSASQTVTADIKLKLGSTSTTVMVSSQANLLTETTSDVATTVDHDLVDNLPYPERSSLEAILTVPGVSGDATMPGGILSENPGIFQSTVVPGASIRVGGGWPGQTSILIDGSDITQASYPRAGISLSGSLVQETTVITNGLSARYGRTGGGVIVQASRSGANSLHAEASWRHNDPGLNAFPYLSTARSGTHQNFFGAYVGGPVYIPHVYNGHNRTFFYVGVEPARLQGTSGSQVTLPTPAEIAGDFSNSYALINTTILKAQGVDAALAAPRIGGLYYQSPVNAQGFPVGAKYTTVSQYVPIANNNVSAQLAQNPLAKYVMSQFPTPQNPGPYVSFYRPDGLWLPNGTNASLIRGVQNVDNRYSARVDHVIGVNDRAFVRYTDVPLSSQRFYGYPLGTPVTQVAANEAQSKNFIFSETHVFTNSLVNEFRANYMRDRQEQLPPPAAITKDWASQLGLTPSVGGVGFPSLGTIGYSLQAGTNSYSFQVDENYQLSDDITWTHGRHTITAGLDIRHLQSNQYNQGGVYGGSYNFSTGTTNNGSSGGSILASLDLGLINSFSNTPTPVPAYYRWHYYAGYVQDDIKLRSNLTLNVGLRWEAETPRSEKYNNQGTFVPGLKGTLNGQPVSGAFCFSGACGLSNTLWPTNYKGFEPRIGIAWVPMRFMTVRASYSIMRVPLSGYGSTPTPDFNVSSQGVGGQTGGVVANQVVDYITNPVGPLTSALSSLAGSRGPFFTAPAGIAIPYINQSDMVPYVQQWGLAIQFQLSRATMLQAVYNGSNGVHMISNTNTPLNFPNLPTLFGMIKQGVNFGANAPNTYAITQNGSVLNENTYQFLLPYQNFYSQNLNEYLPRNGNSNYNALYLGLSHRYSNGLSLQGSFSWAKSIDDIGGNAAVATGAFSTSPVQNPYNLRGERAVSTFDIPLRMSSGYNYELPFGKSHFLSTGVHAVDTAIQGWTTSGIFTIQDGFPWAPNLGSAGYFVSTGGGNPLPNGITLRPDLVAGQGCLNTANWRVDPLNTSYYNPAAFTVPGSLGNPAFGDAPRTLTDCRTPKTVTLDVSLNKRFYLGREGRSYLQLGANASNVTNHPNFFMNGKNAFVTGFNTGSITNPAVPAFAQQANFGMLNVPSTASLSRTVMLNVRLVW